MAGPARPTTSARPTATAARGGPTSSRGSAWRSSAGEVVALEGPSGSGKTTLLSILGCLLTPTSGRLEIDGRGGRPGPARTGSGGSAGDSIGFVFQQFNLFPSLTAAENVEYALNIKGHRGRGAGDEAGRWLDAVGLADRLDFRPRDLSGGQKQRVAVARALAGGAPIILADEPTGNLDHQAGEQVLDLFRDLARREGRALLIVTHDPKVRRIADRVVAVRDGRASRAGGLTDVVLDVGLEGDRPRPRPGRLPRSSSGESTRGPSAGGPRPAAAARPPRRRQGRVVAEGRVVARPGAEVTVGTEAGGTVLAVLRRPRRPAVRKGDLLVEFRSDDQRARPGRGRGQARRGRRRAGLPEGANTSGRSEATTGPRSSRPSSTPAAATTRSPPPAARRPPPPSTGAGRPWPGPGSTSPIDGVVLASLRPARRDRRPRRPAGHRLRPVPAPGRGRGRRVRRRPDRRGATRSSITAEGYERASWRGTVEEIPDRVAGRTLRPDDPGRPTDTRVLLVKIGLTTRSR